VFLLSLAVWVFFYVKTPDAPLGAPEIAIVVALCGAIVLGVQRITRTVRKERRHNAKPKEVDGPSSGSGPAQG
jgi:hypothetical protein